MTNTNYTQKAGIYKLTCSKNGKLYIGKATNIRNRLYQHKHSGKASSGKCYFQNAIIKHGWDSFNVEILEIFENFDKVKDNERLLMRESHYIKEFDSTNRDIGYNRCSRSTDRTGVPHSEEAKAKMRGMKRSEESKEKMRGRKPSEETREKMRNSQLGNRNSLGRKHSEESKLKMSKAKMGRKLSKEHSENIGKSRLGIPRSPETREKVRLGNLGNKNCLGRIQSEETREKIRQTKLKNKLEKQKNEVCD